MATPTHMSRRGFLKVIPAAGAACCIGLACAAVPPAPQRAVHVRSLGYANTWTWEEHMEHVTRNLPPEEAKATWAKYGARRAAKLKGDQA